VGGICYHVINRGNARATVFHDESDYKALVHLLHQSQQRRPMRVLAYCLMPNHVHLVLWPRQDGELSRWMQWLLTAHVRRHHRRHGSSGHIWQGRFKAFPIQHDHHLLTVLRYVERNPLRANLVARAQDWPWASLNQWSKPSRPAFLDDGPVPRPPRWTADVNRTMTAAELESVRRSVARGAPFGGQPWQKRTALRLGLEASLRPRGRPKKKRGHSSFRDHAPNRGEARFSRPRGQKVVRRLGRKPGDGPEK
jgi:putative transposase